MNHVSEIKTLSMRKIGCCVFFFITILQIHCQQTNSASIDFSSNEYNFNEIKEDGGFVVCSFEFLNGGKSNLVIKEILTTCGCTSPSWSKTPIAPGKKGYVKVQFDPREHYGTFKETVIVKTNAIDSAITLAIRGFVTQSDKRDSLKIKVGDLYVKSQHINFGYIYKGKIESKKLEIANYGKKPMHVELTNLPSYMDAMIYPSTLRPGGYGGIVIYYYTDKIDEWDYVIDRVGVMINGKKDSKAVIDIAAIIREDFSSMTPELLELAPKAVFQSDTENFGNVENKKEVSSRFLLRNQGQSDLIIRAIKPTCGCTVVNPDKTTISPGDSTYIESKLILKGLKGYFNKSVTVITNDPKDYKQTLWMIGNNKK
jgi:hypothetical protein